MRLNIKVVPKSSKNLVQTKGGELRVYVSAPPEKGKANQAARELLAEYFRVSKNKVQIIVGHNTRHKIIEVDE